MFPFIFRRAEPATYLRSVVQIFSLPYCYVFFTLTDRASTIPSNIRGCQSSTWSQRGTKVNGSHHGDNPLLRPTGIQIATKVMPLYKRWHHQITKRFIKPPLLHIESSLDRLGLLSPTHDRSVLSNKSDKYVLTSFDQQFQVSQGHCKIQPT